MHALGFDEAPGIADVNGIVSPGGCAATEAAGDTSDVGADAVSRKPASIINDRRKSDGDRTRSVASSSDRRWSLRVCTRLSARSARERRPGESASHLPRQRRRLPIGPEKSALLCAQTPRALRRFRPGATGAVGLQQRNPRTDEPIVVQRPRQSAPPGVGAASRRSAREIAAVHMEDIGTTCADQRIEPVALRIVGVQESKILSANPKPQPMNGVSPTGVIFGAHRTGINESLDTDDLDFVPGAMHPVGVGECDTLDATNMCRRKVGCDDQQFHGTAANGSTARSYMRGKRLCVGQAAPGIRGELHRNVTSPVVKRGRQMAAAFGCDERARPASTTQPQQDPYRTSERRVVP